MSTIIVIEPRPLIRRGIVQLISETLPECQVDVAASWDAPGGRSAQRAGDRTRAERAGYTLMLLSIATLEPATHQTIVSAQKAYRPKSILLLSEVLSSWPPSLPAYVIGCVPLHACPEQLQASIRLAMTDNAEAAQPPPPAPASNDPPLPLAQDASTTRATDTPVQQAPPSLIDHQESIALGLTPRQYEVLVLLARGHTLKAIAQHLNIAATTAKVHAETVYQRLHVHNRTEAIYAAISRGATLGWSNIAREMSMASSATAGVVKRSG